MEKIKFLSIDQYHDAAPLEVKNILNQIRTAIKQAAPKATEVISYNMPAFKGNSILVYYMAHKDHIGFYPLPDTIVAFKNELESYKTSKGAIQFPMHKKMPISLIKKMVKYRVTQDNEKSLAAKK